MFFKRLERFKRLNKKPAAPPEYVVPTAAEPGGVHHQRVDNATFFARHGIKVQSHG